ncbi:MAG: HAMP domain-containing histidine kinase [Cyclobacteriaceae bacterium]|nr:HAMP domain-containing histidine kinase [Cyclobacteriaceae bacterium]
MDLADLQAQISALKEEKYQLLKLVNHDIRSPFNRIFALLQLFEMEATDISGQQRAYLDSMILSILSGLEMITNLRDMREIDAGNVVVEKTELDILPLLHRCMRTFSKQMELKKITIEIKASDDEIIILSDEFYVQRVIENVLSNAVKFSRLGKKVHVELLKTDKGVEIYVEDAGEGIKVEEEYLLFQKFKKLSNVASGGEGCLGLGLYNTTYFLQKLGGGISLIRKEDAGSTFMITLPAK